MDDTIIKGDGLADVAVTKRMGEELYVVFGNKTNTDGFIDLNRLDSTLYGFIVTVVVYSADGFPICGGGDLNGDGFDEFVVGVRKRTATFIYIKHT